MTLVPEDGAFVAQTYAIAPHSRTNIAVGCSGGFGAAADHRRFGAIVESLPAAAGGAAPPIVVERAIYSDALGVTWAAGTNALATPIR